jgi:hypothetical protein
VDAEHSLPNADSRDSSVYARAAIIFKEKREIFCRLSELNLELRSLVKQDPDAVTAARMDVPFRRPARRLKRAAVPLE